MDSPRTISTLRTAFLESSSRSKPAFSTPVQLRLRSTRRRGAEIPRRRCGPSFGTGPSSRGARPTMLRFPHLVALPRPRRARCPVKRKDVGARLALAECWENLKKLHVAVVGGGFAGLMAARRLGQQGVKVTLYEARKEVGGRVLSNPNFSEGRITEEGAELIGSFHTKWLELSREVWLVLIHR